MTERMSGEEIENKIYNYLLSCEPMSLNDATKIRLKTGIKSYESVIRALLKLELTGRLDSIISIGYLGGRKIMVRK